NERRSSVVGVTTQISCPTASSKAICAEFERHENGEGDNKEHLSLPPPDTRPSRPTRKLPQRLPLNLDPELLQGRRKSHETSRRARIARSIKRSHNATAPPTLAFNYRPQVTNPALQVSDLPSSRMDFESEIFPAAGGRWIGKLQKRVTICLARGAQRQSFKLCMGWNHSHALTDSEGRIITYFRASQGAMLMARCTSGADKFMNQNAFAWHEQSAFTPEQEAGRRGDFVIGLRVSHGGGQSCQVILCTTSRSREILDLLLENEDIRRIAGSNHPHLRIVLPRLFGPTFRTAFPATTFKPGPCSRSPLNTRDHGTSLRTLRFDRTWRLRPQTWWSSDLFDLGLIIEFPPGSTTCYHQAYSGHGNCRIRMARLVVLSPILCRRTVSMVRYGFKGDKDISKSQKQFILASLNYVSVIQVQFVTYAIGSAFSDAACTLKTKVQFAAYAIRLLSVPHARCVLGYRSPHTPSAFPEYSFIALARPFAFSEVRRMLGMFSGTVRRTRRLFFLMCAMRVPRYSFVTNTVRSAFSECDACSICSRVLRQVHRIRRPFSEISQPFPPDTNSSGSDMHGRRRAKNPNLHIRAASPDSDAGCCTPPHQTENIPLFRLHPLPNGNVGWSTTYHPVSASPVKRRREHFVDADGMPELPENREDDVEHLPPPGDPDLCDTSWMDFAYLENLAETVVNPRRRRPADNPLLCWIQDRDTFVAEDIRWDGPQLKWQMATAIVLHEEVSASQLIITGLDLEEQQRDLVVDAAAAGPHSTDLQVTRIQVRRNILSGRSRVDRHPAPLRSYPRQDSIRPARKNQTTPAEIKAEQSNSLLSIRDAAADET
ncbi:hypothetical protein Hypma_004685, partial [Hypsizygus marmoreus]